MTPREKRNERLAAKMIKHLNGRHYDAYYCHNTEELLAKVKELIPEGSSISWEVPPAFATQVLRPY